MPRQSSIGFRSRVRRLCPCLKTSRNGAAPNLKPSTTHYFRSVDCGNVYSLAALFEWELGKSANAIWAGSVAVAMGILSIDVEAGGSGVVDAQAVKLLTEGFNRTLSHLGMIRQRYPSPTGQRFLFDRQSVKSSLSGSWVSLKAAGETVMAGELLGYVTDWHGRAVFEASSPKDGLLMLRLSAQPVNQGETLVVVGSTKSHAGDAPSERRRVY